MNKKRLPPIVFSLTLFLSACASDDVSSVGPHVRPSPQEVMNRCLAAVATPGFAPPTEATLGAWQWKRYVSCKLGGNMLVNPKKVPMESEAIVSIRAASDGSIVSVKLLRPSGNDDLDEAVERAIDAAGPLPAVPRALHLARIDMHFHRVRVDPLALQPGQPGIGGEHNGRALADDSH
ncbi:energy transducer TonB [Paraburkholderia lycopersici]|uniref:TonB family C-terminal domain-containing protein n=1 Tax=Paraburkholderia lycopersici TaxID=416944 RepID=A0A1G6S1G6_9BURK|nr:energy transducer TonB [Paraburkholderia lycopersici]SDD10762.1 TonB family C-terminal domain-containing protein [Paraburkholderia lycopersici]